MDKYDKILLFLKPYGKMAAILIIGFILCKCLIKCLRKALNKTTLDKSLVEFILKAVRILFYIIIILSALSSINVSTAGLLAALSAAAVGVAVALKDSLGNVAGGLLLLLSPRFVTGDHISVGNEEGKVCKVDLLHTSIRTFDNRVISIPNGILINSNIVNYSQIDTRRIDIIIPVSYEADIEVAKEILYKKLLSYEKILTEPEKPFVRVKNYGDSSVNVIVRAWVKSEDYWNMYYDLTEDLRNELKNKNMDFPYNKLDVNISK